MAALKVFAADPSLSASGRTQRGEVLRAVDIQRRYLAAAERCLGTPFFPAWAGDACRRWRSVLDLLDERPGDAWRALDWASKLRVFRRHVESRGVSLERAPQGGLPESIPRQVLLELYELDARYVQLGPGSLFSALEAGGCLDHRVPGADRIDAALVEPPAMGRGKTRGEQVQRLAGDGGRYVCDWRGIVDVLEQRFLDFGDPLRPEEKWRPSSRRRGVRPGSSRDEMSPLSLLEMLRLR